MKESLIRLHDCKRGLRKATQSDFNEWWREIASLRSQIENLEVLLRAEEEHHLETQEDRQRLLTQLSSAANDIPLCAGHADWWFTSRNHLATDRCVVCAFEAADKGESIFTSVSHGTTKDTNDSTATYADVPSTPTVDNGKEVLDIPRFLRKNDD